MNEPTGPERRIARSSEFALWIGLMLPPIVWAIQMQTNYWMVRGACARASNKALIFVTAVSLLLLCLAGLSAAFGWRRVGAKWPTTFGDIISRRRFMAALGLLTSAMFFLVVLAQGIAVTLIHPCQQ